MGDQRQRKQEAGSGEQNSCKEGSSTDSGAAAKLAEGEGGEEQEQEAGKAGSNKRKGAGGKRKRASAGPAVPNANGQKFVELQRVVAEMRPPVLHTLKTPNFQHGKAVQNIRRALREIRTLCKQIRSETVLIAKHTPKRAYDGEMGVGLARYRQRMAAAAPAGALADPAVASIVASPPR